MRGDGKRESESVDRFAGSVPDSVPGGLHALATWLD